MGERKYLSYNNSLNCHFKAFWPSWIEKVIYFPNLPLGVAVWPWLCVTSHVNTAAAPMACSSSSQSQLSSDVSNQKQSQIQRAGHRRCEAVFLRSDREPGRVPGRRGRRWASRENNHRGSSLTKLALALALASPYLQGVEGIAQWHRSFI